MTPTTTIEHVLVIEAAPATVFEMWTTADVARASSAADAEFDLRHFLGERLAAEAS